MKKLLNFLQKRSKAIFVNLSFYIMFISLVFFIETYKNLQTLNEEPFPVIYNKIFPTDIEVDEINNADIRSYIGNCVQKQQYLESQIDEMRANNSEKVTGEGITLFFFSLSFVISLITAIVFSTGSGFGSDDCTKSKLLAIWLVPLLVLSSLLTLNSRIDNIPRLTNDSLKESRKYDTISRNQSQSEIQHHVTESSTENLERAKQFLNVALDKYHEEYKQCNRITHMYIIILVTTILGIVMQVALHSKFIFTIDWTPTD